MDALVCTQCTKTYSLNDPIWKCSSCGGVLDLEFRPTFDRNKISSRPLTLWRYREALPLFSDENILSLGEGCTLLSPVDFAGTRVWVKQDQLCPSGSYKDRGAAILISKVKELGIKKVVEDSSGNAGCAIAAYCTRGGIRCEIFVPASTSPGKLAQIQHYGAHLHLIPGSREDTAAAVLKAAETDYYASHAWNPFFFHGTKTFAYETWEQLGWQAPDTLILPAGHGTLLLGAALGFQELAAAGLAEKIPKIIAVQAANCAPLAAAFEQELACVPAIEKEDTLAEGIAIAEPLRGMQILRAVKDSGGKFITVHEEEIASALRGVCRQGFYIEPTAAAVVAGIWKYVQTAPSEVIVSIFTGHGLKSTEKMLKLLSSQPETAA
ncbi:MAG: threonine synthase [Anaerolineaceae bacterium]|nr:threonine synthase [Anaerolineaceae bacterium]